MHDFYARTRACLLEADPALKVAAVRALRADVESASDGRRARRAAVSATPSSTLLAELEADGSGV